MAQINIIDGGNIFSNMRWINHELTALSITYAVTDSFALSLIAGSATVIPDAIEILFPIKHRGIVHSPVFWAVVFIVSYISILLLETSGAADQFNIYIGTNMVTVLFQLIGIEQYSVYGLLKYLSKGIAIAVYLHLAIDFLSTTGIPILKNRHYGLNLYKTFEISEAYAVLAIVIPSLLVSLYRHNAITILRGFS